MNAVHFNRRQTKFRNSFWKKKSLFPWPADVIINIFTFNHKISLVHSSLGIFFKTETVQVTTHVFSSHVMSYYVASTRDFSTALKIPSYWKNFCVLGVWVSPYTRTLTQFNYSSQYISPRNGICSYLCFCMIVLLCSFGNTRSFLSQIV